MNKVVALVFLGQFFLSALVIACDDWDVIEQKIIREQSTQGALIQLIECEKRGELDAELYWRLFHLSNGKNGESETYSLDDLDVNLYYLCESAKRGFWFAIDRLKLVMQREIPGSGIENNYAVVNCLDNILLMNDFLSHELTGSWDYIVDPQQVEHCLGVDSRALQYNECL
jgi:hypothetical protein